MGNRFCVTIGDDFYPVNFDDGDNPLGVVLTSVERIGDDVLVAFRGDVLSKKLRFLRSKGMVKDSTYLVDLENKEAWPFSLS